MQYQERINVSQQPQGEVRHHQCREDNYQRRQRRHQREKTATNDKGDYAYRGAINDETTPTEEPSTTEDCVGVSCP